MVDQVDQFGTQAYQAEYDAFGTHPVEDGSTEDRQRANTKEEDPTGLLNEGFRYRDLDTGTFITRDPLGFLAGPNDYVYAGQNPWSRFDPRGLDDAPPGQPMLSGLWNNAHASGEQPIYTHSDEESGGELISSERLEIGGKTVEIGDKVSTVFDLAAEHMPKPTVNTSLALFVKTEKGGRLIKIRVISITTTEEASKLAEGVEIAGKVGKVVGPAFALVGIVINIAQYNKGDIGGFHLAANITVGVGCLVLALTGAGDIAAIIGFGYWGLEQLSAWDFNNKLPDYYDFKKHPPMPTPGPQRRDPRNPHAAAKPEPLPPPRPH